MSAAPDLAALPARPLAAPRRRRPVRDRFALAMGLVLAAIVLMALLAPWLAPLDPYETTPRPFLSPFWGDNVDPGFPLGTDGQGRDMLSRLLYGTRLTLLIGLSAVSLGGAIGACLGLLAAFYRRLDGVIMRGADILLSFPAILLGLAFAAVLGPGGTAIVVALSIAAIPEVARVTRGSAALVMEQDYVMAGRSLGLTDRDLILRYVALNCVSAVFVFLTIRFGQIILTAAALSFLGLGAKPPAAELGMMASQGRDALLFAPWIATLPSLVIVVIVLAANVLGDALRDRLDPRLRNG